MPCEYITDSNGKTIGIACSRGNRRKRCKCGRPSTKLCDYPLRGPKQGQTLAAARTATQSTTAQHTHGHGGTTRLRGPGLLHNKIARSVVSPLARGLPRATMTCKHSTTRSSLQHREEGSNENVSHVAPGSGAA
jgi:hypothetical protein